MMMFGTLSPTIGLTVDDSADRRCRSKRVPARLIRDEFGRKRRSPRQRHRSAGLVEQFGADALRFTLAASASRERRSIGEDHARASRNFATKCQRHPVRALNGAESGAAARRPRN